MSVVVRCVVTLVIVFIGFSIAGGLISTREEAKRVTEPPPPRLVQTILVTSREVPRLWSAYGTARALRSTDLGAEVASIVLDRPDEIQAGVRLEKGELIVELDGYDYRRSAEASRETIAALEAQIARLDVERDSMVAQVEFAEESVALAKEELQAWYDANRRGVAGAIEENRLKREVIGFERDAETQRDRLGQIPPRRAELAAQVERERANLRVAERNIERCTIRAPYDGRLQSIEVHEGERVGPGSPIARLVDLTTIEVPLRVAVSSSSSVRVGDRVFLGTSADGSARWEGRVSRIAPEADSGSRSITVFAVVEQDPEDASADPLLPGQFLVGRVEGRLVSGARPVPRSAIDEDRVLVVDADGTVDQRVVTVAFYTDASFPEIDGNERQWAIVSSGVEVGERVVTSNLDELRVGMTVTATEPGPLETARADNGQAEG